MLITSFHSQRGVTLIELAITLTIVAIALVLGLPSFTTWMNNQRIKNAAQTIQEGMQLARMEAVRRNTKVFVTIGTDASWRVGCSTVSGTVCPATISTRNVTQSGSNAQITATNLTGDKIEFDGSGRVSFGLTNTASPLLLDITNGTDSDCMLQGGTVRCLRIVATRFGQIRMCDRAMSERAPNDARAC